MAAVSLDELVEWWAGREALAPPCELWRIPCPLAAGATALVWYERGSGGLSVHALAWRQPRELPVHVALATVLEQPGEALAALAAALAAYGG
jgi:hypothetical protein